MEEEFPHISSHVKAVLGISMSESYVPVVPAQHYSCGGILTNTRGETDVKGKQDKTREFQLTLKWPKASVNAVNASVMHSVNTSVAKWPNFTQA